MAKEGWPSLPGKPQTWKRKKSMPKQVIRRYDRYQRVLTPRGKSAGDSATN
jgi:hypothetical protein